MSTRTNNPKLKELFSKLFKKKLHELYFFQGQTDKEACECYEKLQKGDKSKIFEKIGQKISLQAKQVQKHYANSFKSCMYEHKKTKDVDEVIKYLVCVWMTQPLSEQSSKPILTYVKERLKELTGLSIFPPAVDAYANEQKKRYQSGKLWLEKVKYKPGMKTNPEISPNYRSNCLEESIQGNYSSSNDSMTSNDLSGFETLNNNQQYNGNSQVIPINDENRRGPAQFIKQDDTESQLIYQDVSFFIQQSLLEFIDFLDE